MTNALVVARLRTSFVIGAPLAFSLSARAIAAPPSVLGFHLWAGRMLVPSDRTTVVYQVT